MRQSIFIDVRTLCSNIRVWEMRDIYLLVFANLKIGTLGPLDLCRRSLASKRHRYAFALHDSTIAPDGSTKTCTESKKQERSPVNKHSIQPEYSELSGSCGVRQPAEDRVEHGLIYGCCYAVGHI